MKRFICVILCAIMSMSLVLSVSADGSIVPTIYDKEAEKENGVGRLSDEEVVKFQNSAQVLKDVIAQIEI